MWAGILFVGAVMAAGTLLVLDASLPGGLIEGSGDLRYAQTMAFTTLTMFQLFNVFNARSDERSAFDGLFANRWLWAAVVLSLLLHAAVVYVPVPAAGLLDRGLGRGRLAGLRGGGELGAVAARAEQGASPGDLLFRPGTPTADDEAVAPPLQRSGQFLALGEAVGGGVLARVSTRGRRHRTTRKAALRLRGRVPGAIR